VHASTSFPAAFWAAGNHQRQRQNYIA
jgi:hypothetical protein